MAYDRYDRPRERGRHDQDRGFFERAGDEIASWFGDEEAERRRHEEDRMGRGDWNRDRGRERDRGRYNIGGWGDERSMDRERGYGRDYDRDRYDYRGYGRDWDRTRDSDRGQRSYQPMNRGSGDRDYRGDTGRGGYAGYDRDFSASGGFGGSSRDYMSPTGPSFGYGGSFGSGNDRGYAGGGGEGRDYDRSESAWGRDDYRNTSYAGSNRDNDRHYDAWRQRQLNELDRDYEQYCRERQDRFESDFGSWREERMNKRQHLGNIREHMDVVGSDGETIGKVDCVKGDRIVLTKSDSPDNRHHAIDCSMIQTVEGDQVRLDMPAEEAKSRWEDAEKRGFFGRDRDEEDVNLNRSFSGTYES